MMQPPPSSTSSVYQRAAGFQSTLWSRVRVAGRKDRPDSEKALEQLCRLYWGPIYAFLRRHGHERQNALDLTQGFFVYLLEKNLFQKADPGRGRFRSFLLGSLKIFVSNQQAKDRALKRGGRARFHFIDAESTDPVARYDPVTDLTPEKLFERKWALTVIGEAVSRLSLEYAKAGLEEQFSQLLPYLTGSSEDYLSNLAVRLGKSAQATRVLVHRLRNRFRRHIRAVIADTVLSSDAVEEELRHLESALRN